MPRKRHPFPHPSLHSAHGRPPSRRKLQKTSPFRQNFPSSQVFSPQRLSVIRTPAWPLQLKIFSTPTGKTVASPYFLGRVGREWRLLCHADGVLIRVDWAAKNRTHPRVVTLLQAKLCFRRQVAFPKRARQLRSRLGIPSGSISFLGRLITRTRAQDVWLSGHILAKLPPNQAQHLIGYHSPT